MDQYFVYNFSSTICGFYLETFHKLTWKGLDHVPRKGGFILAPNHMSHLDPPLVGNRLQGFMYYIARSTLLIHPFMKWLLPRLRVIPIDRDSKSEIRTLKKIISRVKEGHGALIFPEGTRSPDGNLQEPKNGVGLIACRSEAPVIPARIFGTYEAFSGDDKFPKIGGEITCIYRPPLEAADYDPGNTDKNRYEVATHRIMDAIRNIECDKYNKRV